MAAVLVLVCAATACEASPTGDQSASSSAPSGASPVMPNEEAAMPLPENAVDNAVAQLDDL